MKIVKETWDGVKLIAIMQCKAAPTPSTANGGFITNKSSIMGCRGGGLNTVVVNIASNLTSIIPKAKQPLNKLKVINSFFLIACKFLRLKK